MLRVKGGGPDLKLVMDDVLALLDRQDMGDQETVSYLGQSIQEPAGPRSPIETPLQGLLRAQAVVHTHADAIASLTNNDRVQALARAESRPACASRRPHHGRAGRRA